MRGRSSSLFPLSYDAGVVEEGKGVEPSGLSPGPVFETGRVTRRTAFQLFSKWSRMQDSNPLNLFTKTGALTC
jgi:hypothetical protein